MPNVKRTRVRRAVKGRKAVKRPARPARSMRRKAPLYKGLRFGFPNIYKCRMRYSRQVTLNPGIDTPATYSFIANALYAPEEFEGSPAGAHQPYPWDELIDKYTYATVLGAICKVKAISSTNSNPSPLQYFQVTYNKNSFSASTFASVSTDYSHWNEAVPGRKILNLTFDGNIMGNKTSDYTSVARYSARKQWGVPARALIANPDHANNVASNPAALNRVYFNLVAMAPDATTDPAACTYDVLIEYIVAFSGRKIISQS